MNKHTEKCPCSTLCWKKKMLTNSRIYKMCWRLLCVLLVLNTSQMRIVQMMAASIGFVTINTHILHTSISPMTLYFHINALFVHQTEIGIQQLNDICQRMTIWKATIIILHGEWHWEIWKVAPQQQIIKLFSCLLQFIIWCYLLCCDSLYSITD